MVDGHENKMRQNDEAKVSCPREHRPLQARLKKETSSMPKVGSNFMSHQDCNSISGCYGTEHVYGENEMKYNNNNRTILYI